MSSRLLARAGLSAHQTDDVMPRACANFVRPIGGFERLAGSRCDFVVFKCDQSNRCDQ
jgi:hypothetical protein